MKRRIILLSLSFFIFLTSSAQGGQWAWINGSNTPNASAAYGIKGVPSIYNTPGGVTGAAYWPDMQGNFWIMGGFNVDINVPCAMWRYSPSTNEWTWMSGNNGIQQQDVRGPGAPVYGVKGVAATANFPGARVWSTQWTDNNGNLWLFGGSGWDSTGYPEVFSDLWEYNITSNLWTWVSGSAQADAPTVYGPFQQPTDSAEPGNRYGAGSAWVDANNNLWLFGGVPWDTGANVASYNDMWRYNISTNQWTWMSGPQGMGDAGFYGVKDVESATNRPPHRTSNTRWKDACGNFYLWGGGDFWNSTYQYDDVWKYDIGTNYWVWIAGHNTDYFTGTYTQYCTDTGNFGPSARTFNTTAQVLGATDAFVAYAGYNHTGGSPGLDDLWVFNSSINQWKWIGGQQGANVPATYGTMGVPSASNLPGARYESCMWIDTSGNMWMFGGEQVTNTYSMFNDIWKFIPDTACTEIPLYIGKGATYQLSANNTCGRSSDTLSLSGMPNASVSPASAVTWLDSAHAVLSLSTTTTYSLSWQDGCSISFTVRGGSVNGEITANPLIFCPGDSATVCATSAFATYSWNTGETTQCIQAKDAGNYYVSVTDTGGCTGVSNHVSIATYPPISISISKSGDTITAYGSNQFYQWQLDGQLIPGATNPFIIATQTGNYLVEITDSNGCHFYSNPVTVTGIDEPKAITNLVVYPNPASGDSWYIEAGTEWLGAQIEIFDIKGQQVYKATLNSTSYPIPLHISAGVYMLRVKSNTLAANLKLIKL